MQSVMEEEGSRWVKSAPDYPNDSISETGNIKNHLQ